MIEPEVKLEHPQKVFEKKKTIFRSYQVIWYALGVIEVLIGFRFFLKLIGANSTVGFTKVIYTFSEPFAGPFLGVVAPTLSGPAIIEWSTLIAVIVYLIVAYGIVRLLQFVKPVKPDEVEQAVDAT